MSVDPPVGRRWPAHEYEVGREKIREYAAAIGADAEIHREHAAARALGYPAAVAPPTFAAVYVAVPLASVMFDPAVGVFDPAVGLAGYRLVLRRQEWEWGEPVCAGARITTVAGLDDAGERDGSQFRVFTTESRDDAGVLVCRGRYEGVVPGPRRGGSPRAEPEPERGEPLPPLRVTPDRFAPVRYAGASGDFTPFHLDPDFARSLGLPGVILHGLYTYAQLARALVDGYGGDPRVLRSLSARFRRPAVPERELVAEAWVSGEEESGVTLTGRVSQDGKDVLDRAVASIRPK
jgi:acyl dehydratase